MVSDENGHSDFVDKYLLEHPFLLDVSSASLS